MKKNIEYDVEKIKKWEDKDSNVVYGDIRKYNKPLEYLMSYDKEDVISKKGIKIRKIFHPLFTLVLPLTSKNKLKVVKNYDISGEEIKVPKDKKIIFVPNHGFKDDIALSIITAKYHSYVVFASMPDFFFTMDGYALWANGVFTMDRKDNRSKSSLLEKINYGFNNGLKRVIIFPEGVWCKDPSSLVLNLWKGAYIAAKENDAVIMPISLLNKDMKIDGDVFKGKKGACYSMLGNIIDPKEMSWEEVERQIRDEIATNRYKLMEEYSKFERDEIGDADSYWDSYISELINNANRLKNCSVGPLKKEVLLYDYSIENNKSIYDEDTKTFIEAGAEFIPKTYKTLSGEEKQLIDEYSVFRPVRDINVTPENAKVYSKTLKTCKKKRDYYE